MATLPLTHDISALVDEAALPALRRTSWHLVVDAGGKSKAGTIKARGRAPQIGGKRRYRYLHRAAYEVAFGAPPKGMQVFPKDGNFLDARSSNLEALRRGEWHERRRGHGALHCVAHTGAETPSTRTETTP